MKCFNPIVHPGGAVPSPAIVARVLVAEGEEVRPGQVLVVLRSA
jgi:biotin carboxyl carrier protein